MVHRTREKATMNLVERCDEIVRLIDKTLLAVVVDTHLDVEAPTLGDTGPGERSARAGAAAVHRRRWRDEAVRL
jgi:hypothetical protein